MVDVVSVAGFAMGQLRSRSDALAVLLLLMVHAEQVLGLRLCVSAGPWVRSPVVLVLAGRLGP